MTHGKPRNWRDICEDVLREGDTDHINDLLEELLKALEERERRRRNPSSPKQFAARGRAGSFG